MEKYSIIREQGEYMEPVALTEEENNMVNAAVNATETTDDEDNE